MERNLTKKLKRELRELTGLAWKRELDAELAKLDESFGLWREKQIDAFELADRIHRFHDGENRELYKFYAYGRSGDSLSVAAAVAKGIIQRDELSTDLLDYLDPEIEHLLES